MKTNPPPLYINIVNNIPSQITAWHETGEEMRATAGGAVRVFVLVRHRGEGGCAEFGLDQPCVLTWSMTAEERHFKARNKWPWPVWKLEVSSTLFISQWYELNFFLIFCSWPPFLPIFIAYISACPICEPGHSCDIKAGENYTPAFWSAVITSINQISAAENCESSYNVKTC